eukprot:CAMPEP_0115247918 /NCGR_PEP_ID=MMETSP0270-20121206/41801_1 /TAXON_ID=71861 /ORGANISM="Scrippsiella trochoidea, Strain CCMP3099" /LENGTH=60 /DNA_ID=CAMNT_0002663201 /DNA_START=1028 /DNA_END=1206 /DNA_ORIENTATION=-
MDMGSGSKPSTLSALATTPSSANLACKDGLLPDPGSDTRLEAAALPAPPVPSPSLALAVA